MTIFFDEIIHKGQKNSAMHLAHEKKQHWLEKKNKVQPKKMKGKGRNKEKKSIGNILSKVSLGLKFCTFQGKFATSDWLVDSIETRHFSDIISLLQELESLQCHLVMRRFLRLFVKFSGAKKLLH